MASELFCRIIRADRIGDHVEYLLCGSVNGNEYPPVRRRYREFTKVWSTLRKHLAKRGTSSDQASPPKPFTLPDLPPKKMFGKMNSGFVTKRMKALENVLQTVCKMPAFASYAKLHVFLGIEGDEMLYQNTSLQNSNSKYDGEASGEATAGDDSELYTEAVQVEDSDTLIEDEDNEWGEVLQRSVKSHTQVGHDTEVHSFSEKQHTQRLKIKMIGMMRHSARLDEISGCTWTDKAMRAYDTPICDFDLPARVAATYKRCKFNFNSVVSSPFRRCLQTAAIVANSLGLKILFVDNRLGEVMLKIISCVDNLEKETSKLRESKYTRGAIEWSYLKRQEAEQIAKNAGLLLCWDEELHVPPLNETSEAFLQRCNSGRSVVEDIYSRWCDPSRLKQQLEAARNEEVAMSEQLSAARECVARASDHLVVALTTIGLSRGAASNRMLDLHSLIQEQEEEEEDAKEALLPVEITYQSAVQLVRTLQKRLSILKSKFNGLKDLLNAQPATPWQSALLVTHADVINQRLQYFKPDELYAPRCCGWIVEDVETNRIVKIKDCDRIM